MTPRRWLVAAAATVALASCQHGQQAGADPVTFTVGREFTLNGGQEAISDENLRVRFTGVLEDSRCPLDVECFWTGQARVAVEVQSPGRPAATAEFNTNPAPGQNRQTVQAGGLTISLKALEPYPQAPDDPRPFEDYRAQLLVQR
ncbi:hypothetical protein [Mycobacterium sp. 1274761.0]|uniref:hypothetical protein n=1 Tax=Mycobacterium sp. 1274761.0 TaxID=1834077 RepID=UPI0007FF1C6B|nr:hypothetical protein [Mycobacterium sp. 1274761.0]OBK72818.1 hypothetical protein A5651_14985 [Mycobacterium sp. 1274761.0]